MITRIKIITLCCIINIVQVIGQTIYPICHIYTINSQNNEFFLRTIPFDNHEQTPTGKTIVFNSDSVKLYEITRHFEISDNRKEVFLSNDGKTIIYVIDREFNWGGIHNKSVEIFKNGISIKQYQLTDLINCDSDYEDCYLFYKEAIDEIAWKLINPWTKEEILVTKATKDTINWSNKNAWSREQEIIYKTNATNFEKELTKKATFFNNDTLYIFTKTNQLIKIDINTANFYILPITNINEEWFSNIKSFDIKSEEFKPSSLYDLPNLSDGKSLKKELAKHLDMAVFLDEKRNSHKYKKYTMKIEILVSKNGKATIDKVDYNYGEISEEKIKSFIESQKFDTKFIPKKTEAWRFSGWLMFMNKDKKESKKEKKQEILKSKEEWKKRIVADSINGFYIPKNLEECFIELNKILKPKDIATIKNLENSDKLSLYHLGLGMWLRNNWGLWGGSRLQHYFFDKGIKHPDNMSGIILKFYYDWVNEKNDEWKNFEDK